MLHIERKVLQYESPDLGIEVAHYALIAHEPKRKILLSHPNLFLYSTTRSSLKTSSRYSNIISRFYRFLSTEDKFKERDISEYHAFADNRDIKRWQLSRQETRVIKQSTKPTLETTYEDAKIVLFFFNWLNTHGYVTNVNVELKTSIANFKTDRLLNYIQAKARVTINAKNIRVLEKEARQSQRRSLINESEIRLYLKCFTDPVYAVMFKLALGTAMRPMDLCTTPYIGNGKNRHIMPYSEMNKEPKTFELTIYGSKGNKTRTIVVHRDDLKELDEQYIKPHLETRRKKYKERVGQDCPLSILFLNEQGFPVTPEKITSRGNAAKVKAMTLDENFRESVNFYESRHWWPTMFLIRFFKEDLLSNSADVMWAACGQALINQMGHDDIKTTFAHYVDMARIVMLANKGRVTELITEAHDGVHAFINQVTSGKLVMGD
ncbi:site-specific integrase [Pseudomonas sp. NA-150]|uniref:site-specific integrase n=1 Tax=Pseudomonas sp. NA-150 TaxID=3367525 RepID=UPI0037C8D8E5